MLRCFGSFSHVLKSTCRYRPSEIISTPLKETATKCIWKRNLHGPLPEFKVERFYGWDACERSLSSSECEPVTLKHLLDLAKSSPEYLLLWEEMSLGYSVQAGHPLLRSKVATRYIDITPEDVGIFAPQEGIYLSMLALVKAGDSCIVSTPCYQSLHSVAEALGTKVIKWNVKKGTDRWFFDLEELERYFQSHSPTLLVLNVPHNPTGAMMSQHDLDYVVGLCRKHNTWLFVDEMYRGLEDIGVPRLENACDVYPEKGISLGGLSKSFGLPGLRIGWIVSHNQHFISKILSLKDCKS
mmetsp:Transcript_14488/g.16792  ORF Transcript_14488/g.16792 Transcript_14488/m.16792 type:complete len:297 (+) Transcript_14488:205-1095(+)